MRIPIVVIAPNKHRVFRNWKNCIFRWTTGCLDDNDMLYEIFILNSQDLHACEVWNAVKLCNDLVECNIALSIVKVGYSVGNLL